MWRMVDDVWDTWPHVMHLINVAQKWYPYIAPGTWPDCDMIPLGRIAMRGERGGDRMSRLTKDEQITLMTFFTIFRSPLMFGGDLPSLDTFTKALLTNKAVLKMHAESTEVKYISNQDGKVILTSRNSNNDERYLAIFNLSDDPKGMSVNINFSTLGIKKNRNIRDMWSG
jgi:alpha-galactosidase